MSSISIPHKRNCKHINLPDLVAKGGSFSRTATITFDLMIVITCAAEFSTPSVLMEDPPPAINPLLVKHVTLITSE